MNKTILLIGDRNDHCYKAVAKFKQKYEVNHFKYIRPAFKEELSVYRLILIEIMTPCDFYTKEETDDYLRTGIIYYEREVERLGIPVLFWSWNEDFRNEIELRENPLIGFVHKNLEEDFLVDAVDNFLRSIQ